MCKALTGNAMEVGTWGLGTFYAAITKYLNLGTIIFKEVYLTHDSSGLKVQIVVMDSGKDSSIPPLDCITS